MGGRRALPLAQLALGVHALPPPAPPLRRCPAPGRRCGLAAVDSLLPPPALVQALAAAGLMCQLSLVPLQRRPADGFGLDF